jgi:hypothetical protein
MYDVNREAELEPPSRVACSDLLGGVVISSLNGLNKILDIRLRFRQAKTCLLSM